jgi:hypothetical protein
VQIGKRGATQGNTDLDGLRPTHRVGNDTVVVDVARSEEGVGQIKVGAIPDLVNDPPNDDRALLFEHTTPFPALVTPGRSLAGKRLLVMKKSS